MFWSILFVWIFILAVCMAACVAGGAIYEELRKEPSWARWALWCGVVLFVCTLIAIGFWWSDSIASGAVHAAEATR